MLTAPCLSSSPWRTSAGESDAQCAQICRSASICAGFGAAEQRAPQVRCYPWACRGWLGAKCALSRGGGVRPHTPLSSSSCRPLGSIALPMMDFTPARGVWYVYLTVSTPGWVSMNSCGGSPLMLSLSSRPCSGAGIRYFSRQSGSAKRRFTILLRDGQGRHGSEGRTRQRARHCAHIDTRHATASGHQPVKPNRAPSTQ